MERTVKILGHPVHQMLIVFPLGLLATSLAFDIAYFAKADPNFGIVSFWMICAGIIGGLLAAVFGLMDWLSIPDGTRAKSIGLWHGIGNVAIVLLFVGSWWLRVSVPDYTPSPSAVTLSAIGVALALVTGWLGGEMVVRLGIGVDKGAHPDASSSLTGRPVDASETSHMLHHT